QRHARHRHALRRRAGRPWRRRIRPPRASDDDGSRAAAADRQCNALGPGARAGRRRGDRLDRHGAARPPGAANREPGAARRGGRVAAALARRPPEGFELVQPRDASRMIVARAAPITANAARGAVLVLHDITDLRRADQIRRDFVANVSHELRTPLTAIRGYIEALRDGEPDAADARKFLEIIARHSAQMERLVSDLLRLARLDARQEALDLAPCDMQQLFNTV